MSQAYPTSSCLPRRCLLSLALSIALGLGGCVVTPEPMTSTEIEQRVTADQTQMFADQEPVTGPIDFHEAAARALKYNLDYRLKLMESALAQGLLDVSRYDMLPKLLVSAGYAERNNAQGGTSVGIETGVETLSPSSTQERNRRLADAEFSWNLLDFGMSYYRSRQEADRVLIAEERRRKVMQTVLQDVRTAYWRAVGAQQLSAQLDNLLQRTRVALGRARAIEKQGLLPQAEALAYQRALLDSTAIITLRRQDLELAQAELAALMSIPPGTRFTLADEVRPPLPAVPSNLSGLETLALTQRPELREEDYRKRVTSNDIKRAMLSTLPGIQLDFNAHYDTNKYLYNNDWIDTGVRVSWNLLRLAALPAMQKAHKAQERTDEMRRMSLSMAVVTQLRVAVQRYGLALADLEQAQAGAQVDQRMLKYTRAAVTSRANSELELIRNEARALLSEYQQLVAYASAQAAWGRLYGTVGLDVLPEAVAKSDVRSLAASLRQTLSEHEQRVLGGISSAPDPSVPPADSFITPPEDMTPPESRPMVPPPVTR